MGDDFYEMMAGISQSVEKPLCKLIDAVRSGVGLIYEPVHVRRMAKAESEALVIRTETELSVSELRQRAAARLSNTETRRQENIESIVEEATQQLGDTCSDAPVDKDWMAAFFDCCKDVGNEEVQKLWGKLLANEVTAPGKYSRRALDALRLMSSHEAATFQLLGFRIWHLDRWPVFLIPYFDQDSCWPECCPFRWDHIFLLSEIGLVESQIKGGWESYPESVLELEYHGAKYRENTRRGSRPSWVYFTSLGAELAPLVTQPAGIKDHYFRECCDCLVKGGWTHDTSIEFRELLIPDDLLKDLNLASVSDSE